MAYAVLACPDVLNRACVLNRAWGTTILRPR
jgi:hypothetical protein